MYVCVYIYREREKCTSIYSAWRAAATSSLTPDRSLHNNSNNNNHTNTTNNNDSHSHSNSSSNSASKAAASAIANNYKLSYDPGSRSYSRRPAEEPGLAYGLLRPVGVVLDSDM